MFKAFSSTLFAALLLTGCGSSDSDDNAQSSGSINLWDYLVSSSSSILSYDSITTQNGEAIATQIGANSREYTVLNAEEVTGPYRTYEGTYFFQKGSFISYGPADTNTSGSYASGTIEAQKNLGDYIYTAGGESGWSNTSGGITSSVFTSARDCTIAQLHNSITLYDGYTYNNVLEVTCEKELDQTYTPTTIVGVDSYKEYYQKGVGLIGKVDANCIVSIAEYGFEFIDDSNSTCVKTTTNYELLHN